MIKKNNKKKILLFEGIVLLVVFLLTIGYSAFSTELIIGNFAAYIRVDKKVRVTSFNMKDTTNGGTSSENEYDVAATYSDLSLPNNNSTVTYEVEVINYGNVEVGISDIKLPSELADILDVEVTGYNLGTKLRDVNDTCEENANGCKLLIKRKFDITLKYKNGVNRSGITTFNDLKISFNFVEAHKVTYTGFTVLSFPMDAKSVLDGQTYSYNIGPYETLLIRKGGVTTTDYTIDNNNLLTIPNVTDDIEIIITEVMLPVRINIVPNTATINYKVQGISHQAVTGDLDTEIAIGSILEVDVTCYGYKNTKKTYQINTKTNDTITMDKVYYLNLNVSPSDAVISYTVDGIAKEPEIGTLSAEFDPGTVINVTITKQNYRTETLTYTMNQNYDNETLNMVRQYQYIVNAVTPSAQTITMSKNGGTSQTITSGTVYLIDEGTNISITSSASGYRIKTITHTVTSDIIDNITLTKTYVYTVNAIKPTDAMLYLTIGDGARTLVSSGYSVVLDENTTVKLEASGTNYKSTVYNHTMTSNITDNVNLLKFYTYTVTCSNKNDAAITITYNGTTYTGTGSRSITVAETESFSWSISRDYYKTQSGTKSITGDTTENISLLLKDGISVSNQQQHAIGLGDSVTYTVTIPDGARIISGSLSGSIRSSVNNRDLTVNTTTGSGTTLWNQGFTAKLTNYTSISTSYSCSDYQTNIEACPSGNVTSYLTKPSSVIMHIENAVKTTITYIPK